MPMPCHSERSEESLGNNSGNNRSCCTPGNDPLESSSKILRGAQDDKQPGFIECEEKMNDGQFKILVTSNGNFNVDFLAVVTRYLLH